MMDFIFYLDSQCLREIMRSIVITLGWTYIALWSLAQHAPDLECKDGWFNPEVETGSSRAESVGQTLFNLYKLCRFAVDTGNISKCLFACPSLAALCPEILINKTKLSCGMAKPVLCGPVSMEQYPGFLEVPGLALNRPPCTWLTANELLRFSSDEIQEEFYRVAGIQSAVFIPCGNGVVELGTTNLVEADEQTKLRIRSLLESITASSNISVPITGASISTSFCSSLLSCSIDSPRISSRVSYVQHPIHSPESSSMVSYLQYPYKSPYDQINIPQDILQYSTPSVELASGLYPYLQTLQLPSSSGLLIRGHDHETTIVHPGSSTQQISVPGLLHSPQASGFDVASSARSMMLSAFDRQRPPSKVLNPSMVEGQYMLKRSPAMWSNIHAERAGSQTSICGSYRPPAATISRAVQFHNMIAERRRREKLKENFEALRSFIPSAPKKDKASLLFYAREYLTSLRSRAEELGERNKQLESELKKLLPPQSQEVAGTSAVNMQQQGSTSTEVIGDIVVRVEVSKIGGSATTCHEKEIVVLVERPTNTINLTIALLKSLREMGIPLISTATSTAVHDPSLPQFRMSGTIRLQDEEVEWVKEGLRRAVSEGSGLPPTSLS